MAGNISLRGLWREWNTSSCVTSSDNSEPRTEAARECISDAMFLRRRGISWPWQRLISSGQTFYGSGVYEWLNFSPVAAGVYNEKARGKFLLFVYHIFALY